MKGGYEEVSSGHGFFALLFRIWSWILQISSTKASVGTLHLYFPRTVRVLQETDLVLASASTDFFSSLEPWGRGGEQCVWARVFTFMFEVFCRTNAQGSPIPATATRCLRRQDACGAFSPHPTQLL